MKFDPVPKPRMLLFDYLGDLAFKDPEWLIEDILPAHSLSAIIGESWSGKTFVALDMGLSIAAGLPYHNLQIKHGAVAYIAGEGARGLKARATAWSQSKSISLQSVPFIVSKQGFNFRDPKSIQAIKHDLSQVENLSLIFVDTLNRNFGGGNENGPEHMGEFISACDDLMQRFNCALSVVHHMGKDKNGSRGHTSFYAALDTEITVRKKGKHDIEISCTKQKDAPEFETLQFLKVSTADSIVLEQVTHSQDPLKINPNEKLALDIFYDLRATKQQCRLHVDDWREEFKRRHTGDNEKSKARAHERARKSLVERKILTVWNDYYSEGDKAT